MKLGKKQILSVLLILAFGVAVALTGFYARNTKNMVNTSASEDIADAPKLLGDAVADESEIMDSSMDESDGVRIDFEGLKVQNSDIYAWITVPGTEINYPVLQKSDAKDPYDNYYLDHQADLS